MSNSSSFRGKNQKGRFTNLIADPIIRSVYAKKPRHDALVFQPHS
jgi:hypothetical protein